MDKYRVKFVYKDMNEYYQSDGEFKKPFDNPDNAGQYSLEEANKIKENYMENPFASWTDIELEKV